ncbi:PqqD family protein [Myxococcota bacterium]|nr:PqqD family protein [Myxococcota bacterium]
MERRPARAPGLAHAELDGELVLVHADGGHVVYLNATAALVWSLCDGERTVAEIVALLGEAYPDAAARMASDVEVALRELDRGGCVVA